MEQFVGIFLLVGLVMILFVYAPAKFKMKDQTENSGYSDKFSDSLRILQSLKQEIRTQNEDLKRESARTFKAKPTTGTASTGYVRTLQPAKVVRRAQQAQRQQVHNNQSSSANNRRPAREFNLLQKCLRAVFLPFFKHQSSKAVSHSQFVKQSRASPTYLKRQGTNYSPVYSNRGVKRPAQKISREQLIENIRLQQDSQINSASQSVIAEAEYNEVQNKIRSFDTHSSKKKYFSSAAIDQQLAHTRMLVSELDRQYSNLEYESTKRQARRK
ncbi:MAG: hypothetical protein LBQ41_04385 [Candidatus Ancillula sp.]|jgi:hypothetical protein|nr:hypothetical protein [Candidatus Ancillula sp.]